MASGIAPKFTPAIAPGTDPELTQHLRQLYSAVNDHDQAIVTLKAQLDAASTTASTAAATAAAVPTGGASGTYTLAALTANGSTGSISLTNGRVSGFTAPS